MKRNGMKMKELLLRNFAVQKSRNSTL